jgi:hypothetical protein
VGERKIMNHFVVNNYFSNYGGRSLFGRNSRL